MFRGESIRIPLGIVTGLIIFAAVVFVPADGIPFSYRATAAVTALMLIWMVTAALASSMGFMLPVGTPPNTIVYGSGYIRTGEMARAGFALNVVSAFLITVWLSVFVPVMLGMSFEMPSWAVITP